MLLGQGAQGAEIAVFGQDAAHVARDRLDDDAGDVLAVFIHDARDGVRVVEGHGDRVLRDALGHAGTRRHAEGRKPGTCVDEQAVAVPVVAADELDDLRALREAACKAQGAHRRLRARVDHAHELHRRICLLHEAHEVGFERRRCAVARAACGGVSQCADDGRMCVSGDERAPRQHIVDILVAVDIENVRALATRDKRRIAVDASVRAHGTVDAARHESLRLLKGGKGFFQVQHISLLFSLAAISPHRSRGR